MDAEVLPLVHRGEAQQHGFAPPIEAGEALEPHRLPRRRQQPVRGADGLEQGLYFRLREERAGAGFEHHILERRQALRGLIGRLVVTDYQRGGQHHQARCQPAGPSPSEHDTAASAHGDYRPLWRWLR